MKTLVISFLIIFCFAQKTNGNTKGLERQVEKAQDILEKGNFQEAISKFQQIIKNHPNNQQQIIEKALLNIAFCYTRLGNYDKALAKYEEFSKRFPKSKIMDYYLKDLSYYYYKTEDYDKSIEFSQRLIKEFPNSKLINDAFVFVRMGECYYIQKRYREALEVYKKASEYSLPLDEASYVQYRIGFCYYYQKKFSEAIEEFQRFLKNYPEDKYAPEVTFRIASSFQEKGLISQAIEEYQRILRDYPQYEYINDTLYQLWECYRYKKDYDSAIAVFKWFIKTYPKNHLLDYAHSLMAISYSKKARFNEDPIKATANFTKAILEVIKSKGYNLRYTFFVIVGDYFSSNLWNIAVKFAIIAGFLMCIFGFINYKKTKRRSDLFSSIGLLLLLLAWPLTIFLDKYGLKSSIGFSVQCIMTVTCVIVIILIFYAEKHHSSEKRETKDE
jgi:TolA-binding protein